MGTYNKLQTRDDNLVPEEIVEGIIQQAPESSAALALGTKIPMSTKTRTVRMLDVLPDAYWVNGDTGLKQTTNQAWTNKTTTAEELATLVVIPDAFADDADIDLWGQIKPRLAEAIGRKLDEAVFWGIEKPASWTDPYLYEGILAAGNAVTSGSSDDFTLKVAQAAENLATDGVDINGFAARPGLKWRLAQLRTAAGETLWQPNTREGLAGDLYGLPLAESKNGNWRANYADLILGDWSSLLIGVRQDITYTVHTDAVITDDAGKVIFNAMQQDSKIMRVVFRVAYMIVDPSTALSDRPFPFAMIRPTGAPAS
jgi:HK97 family phage major capsid protein